MSENIKYQTPEINLIAVNHRGFLLEYIINQTPELCLSAVERNGIAVKSLKYFIALI